MPASEAYSHAVIRVVPRVDRGEFINAGIILHCHALRFLEARVELDERRLLTLAPDVELDVVRAHLQALCAVASGAPDAGPLGRMTSQQRFHWLVAPRSTIIQTSPVHSGVCPDPAEQLERLLHQLVRLPPAVG